MGSGKFASSVIKTHLVCLYLYPDAFKCTLDIAHRQDVVVAAAVLLSVFPWLNRVPKEFMQAMQHILVNPADPSNTRTADMAANTPAAKKRAGNPLDI